MTAITQWLDEFNPPHPSSCTSITPADPQTPEEARIYRQANEQSKQHLRKYLVALAPAIPLSEQTDKKITSLFPWRGGKGGAARQRLWEQSERGACTVVKPINTSLPSARTMNGQKPPNFPAWETPNRNIHSSLSLPIKQNPSNHYVVYLVKFEHNETKHIHYKYGYTMQGVNRRFTSYSAYTLKECCILPMPSKAATLQYENKLKWYIFDILGYPQYTPDKWLDKATECFLIPLQATIDPIVQTMKVWSNTSLFLAPERAIYGT